MPLYKALKLKIELLLSRSDDTEEVLNTLQDLIIENIDPGALTVTLEEEYNDVVFDPEHGELAKA